MQPQATGKILGLSPQQIAELLEKSQTPQRGRALVADAMYRHGFDKAALFLFDMGYGNMFEPWRSSRDYGDMWFRCKGCNRKVKRTGRQSHYDWHKRELLT